MAKLNIKLLKIYSNYLLIPGIARKAITEDYNLIDLQAMDDDSIDYGKHLSFLLYTMKHIHELDTLAMIKDAIANPIKFCIFA